MIFIIFKICSWNKCPAGNLLPDDYNNHESNNKWEMKINNRPVSDLVKVHGNNAALAVGKQEEDEDGSSRMYFTPNSNGQYVIEIKVNESNGYVRISSFVLY